MLAELKREWKFDIEAMVRPPLHTALDHVAMPSPPYPLATCGSTHGMLSSPHTSLWRHVACSPHPTLPLAPRGMLSSPHTSLDATWHALLSRHPRWCNTCRR